MSLDKMDISLSFTLCYFYPFCNTNISFFNSLLLSLITDVKNFRKTLRNAVSNCSEF